MAKGELTPGATPGGQKRPGGNTPTGTTGFQQAKGKGLNSPMDATQTGTQWSKGTKGKQLSKQAMQGAQQKKQSKCC